MEPFLLCHGAIILAGFTFFKEVAKARFYGCASTPWSMAAASCAAFAAVRLFFVIRSRGVQSKAWLGIDICAAFLSGGMAALLWLRVLVVLESSNFHVNAAELGYARSLLAECYGSMKRYPASLDEVKKCVAQSKEEIYRSQGWPAARAVAPCFIGCPHGPANWVERDAKSFRDTGDWVYVNNPKSPDFGAVFIDCNHHAYWNHPDQRWTDL